MSEIEGSIIHQLKEAKTTARLVFFVTDDPDGDDVSLVGQEDMPDWVKQSDILVRLLDGELVECTVPYGGAEVVIWIGAMKLDHTFIAGS